MPAGNDADGVMPEKLMLSSLSFWYTASPMLVRPAMVPVYASSYAVTDSSLRFGLPTFLTMSRVGVVGTSEARAWPCGPGTSVGIRNASGARLIGAMGAKMFCSRKLFTADGDRNALLKETRNEWSGVGLNMAV